MVVVLLQLQLQLQKAHVVRVCMVAEQVVVEQEEEVEQVEVCCLHLPPSHFQPRLRVPLHLLPTTITTSISLTSTMEVAAALVAHLPQIVPRLLELEVQAQLARLPCPSGALRLLLGKFRQPQRLKQRLPQLLQQLLQIMLASNGGK